MYNNTIWNFSYYKIETLHANMESKIWDSQSRSSSPQNSIRPPRKKNIPLHTVVCSFSPHFSMFYTPPNFTVYAERKLPAKCFKICHILDKVCIQKRTHLLGIEAFRWNVLSSTNNKIRMSGWTTTTPPWWSSYWTLTSEWNYAKQAIFGEKNDASNVPPVTPLLFTFLDFMKRTRDIVQKKSNRYWSI